MATEIQACGDKVINDIEIDAKVEVHDDATRDILKQFEDFKRTSAEDKQKILGLEQIFKVHVEEASNLKSQNAKLEEELAEFRKNQAQNVSESQEVQNLKKKSEDLLTRAKGVIFEKTKVCKNQELQIEALTQQVTSLKEVVAITKDLLDIRNIEVKQLKDKLDCMDEKINIEKERHELMHGKMDRMVAMNVELKKEYETQLALFSALRDRYNERDLAKKDVENLRAERDEQLKKQRDPEN